MNYLTIIFIFLTNIVSGQNASSVLDFKRIKCKINEYKNVNDTLVASISDSCNDYFNDLPDGIWKFISRETNYIKIIVNLKKGEIDGQYFEFYEGWPKSLTTYINGVKYGQFIVFGDSGRIIASGYENENVLNGLCKEFFKNGKLKSETLFDYGRIIYQSFYDSNGKKVEEWVSEE